LEPQIFGQTDMKISNWSYNFQLHILPPTWFIYYQVKEIHIKASEVMYTTLDLLMKYSCHCWFPWHVSGHRWLGRKERTKRLRCIGSRWHPFAFRCWCMHCICYQYKGLLGYGCNKHLSDLMFVGNLVLWLMCKKKEILS
jgi:hypothetical protein